MLETRDVGDGAERGPKYPLPGEVFPIRLRHESSLSAAPPSQTSHRCEARIGAVKAAARAPVPRISHAIVRVIIMAPNTGLSGGPFRYDSHPESAG